MNRLTPLIALLFLIACKKTSVVAWRSDGDIYNKAFDFKDENKMDSAFFYFDKAKIGFIKAKDSLGTAKCLLNMGIISTENGDYFGGQESALNAIQYFNASKKEQYPYIESNYNNLGLASHYLTNYSKAIYFYEKSLLYASNEEAKCVVKNNIANIYRGQLAYNKAIAIYEPLLKQPINKVEFARILSNLAFTKWLQKPGYNALPQLQIALKMRVNAKDLSGQNASFAHLADYYANKNPDSALRYARKMYATSKRLKSANDQIQALQKMIRLGKLDEIKPYFILYAKLDDSVQNAHTKAKNQFAVIRYETEKHKAEFLKSEAENAEKQSSIFMQWFMLAILAIGIIFTVLWFKKRNKLLKQQKDLEVKDTELKYVKKIHDRVANKVYQVMTEVENVPHLTKDDILDKLEVIYDISRDISYETIEAGTQDIFSEQLNVMLKSYASATTKVVVKDNEETIWKGVNLVCKLEIFCVLQELMTNMNKHSHAKEVEINFKRENNNIKINYKDDGVGIAKALQCKNGLTNTGTRINTINGTITFDTEIEKGLKINISFPVL
ncbi:ATP-binding protein [Pedobacter changchengzhani]|uniref:histidine kinase n=1 Tax=Pedobacter changchengzhani TaxID=2529274 RepID=A0A4R5MPI8_9SPHI|nr:tetratricopeptide repeat-containing sensor histidine kinase [Pedobacter changchengzhani]TDG37546.1 ATP-binding protein [Pedobacter changchengzhani]